MRVLPSGTCALLVELDDLDAVLGLYAALEQHPPTGVVDVVPAARTVLVVADPAAVALPALAETLRRTASRAAPAGAEGSPQGRKGELVQVPVRYDGDDLADVAELLGWTPAALAQRHTALEWTVAFCGFAPGFGYLTSPGWTVEVPRRPSPRTRVPAGAVALAGPYSGVYPRASPGGWQLLGHTDLDVLDLAREPAALLRPGVRVRFVDVAAADASSVPRAAAGPAS